MDNCLFCRIISGEIPSQKVYEDGYCYAFKDINPLAPTHVVIASKAHVTDIGDAAGLDDATLAAIVRAAGKIAASCGLTGGYRVVSNCGPDALQTVPHWHVHVLGGKKMENMV